jgi:hypothetical protein
MNAEEHDPPTVRIGLWGAPESGKTTFLAALFLAADQLGHRRGQEGPIKVESRDQPSEMFKNLYSDGLASGRQFPEATVASTDPLEWRFTGDLRRTRFADRRAWFLPARHVPLDFRLRLRDHPGRAFDVPVSGRRIPVDSVTEGADRLDLIDELAECDGLIYLFDPLREAHQEDSYKYFLGVLKQLKNRVDVGRLPGQKLPHHLSVCVTKFDDNHTFAQALSLSGMVGVDSEARQPCIPAKDAQHYFDWVCETTRGTAELVRNAILTDFRADRTRYYAVSSVGFFHGRQGRGWNPDDPSNVRTEGALNTIRGHVRPLNVLDPIIDIERALRAGER